MSRRLSGRECYEIMNRSGRLPFTKETRRRKNLWILTDWLIRNTISTSDLAFSSLLRTFSQFRMPSMYKLAFIRLSSSLQMPFFSRYYFVFYFNLLFCLFIIFSSILLQTKTQKKQISFSSRFIFFFSFFLVHSEGMYLYARVFRSVYHASTYHIYYLFILYIHSFDGMI